MKVGIGLLGIYHQPGLAWIDPADAEDTSFPPIHIFDIPQLVAAKSHRAAAARCRLFFPSKKANQSEHMRKAQSREHRSPPDSFTARNPGFRIRTSIAPRKSSRGMRAKGDAFCLPLKSRRDS